MNSNPSFPNRHGALVAAIVVLLALGSLRLIHLGADTPSGMSWSAGLYVDEGYKTLAARNLVLFGEPRWNPADDYQGWMHSSPLTHWAYYWAFELFGPTAESARLVTIAFMLLLLGSYVIGLYGRYPPVLLFIGLVGLGLESTVFFFSRVALFELPLSAFLYAIVFTFAWSDQRRTRGPIIAILLTTVLVTFAVKASAMLYFAPVLVAALVHLALRARVSWQRRVWIYVVTATAAALGFFLVLTAGIWTARVALDPLAVLARLPRNPLIHTSPFVVLLGLFCVLHGLLARPELYLRDLYRISLVGIVLLTPAILALFAYGPLRYYLPILPAYILVILEWIHLRGWTFKVAEAYSKHHTIIVVGLLALIIFYASSGINSLLMTVPATAIGSDPGASAAPMSLILAPTSVLLALMAWKCRAVIFNRKAVTGLVATGALLCLLHNAYILGRFYASPSFQANGIRADLARLVNHDATVAGDWAPFFALGTNIKALYMNRRFNAASRVLETSPDYFLYSETVDSDIVLSGLRGISGLLIGDPIYRSEYSGRKIILYPLVYNPSRSTSDSRSN